MHQIGFLGASKTATVLARYFKFKGLPITGFYSKTPSSLAETIDLVGCRGFSDANQLMAACDVLFVTPKDDAIVSLWNNVDKSLASNKIICHCSGLMTSDVLRDEEASYSTASCHPIFSFNHKGADITPLEKMIFALEGDKTALAVLESILRHTQNEFIILDKNKKTPYHIACVAASNFYVSLLDFAESFLKEAILEMPTASKLSPERILSFLTESVIQKIAQGQTLAQVVTGPLVRQDAQVLNAHKRYLETCSQENQQRYLLLSQQLSELLAR